LSLKFVILTLIVVPIFYLLFCNFPPFLVLKSDIDSSILNITSKIFNDFKGQKLDNPLNLNIKVNLNNNANINRVTYEIQNALSILNESYYFGFTKNQIFHINFAIIIIVISIILYLSESKKSGVWLEEIYYNGSEFELNRFRMRKLLSDLPTLQLENLRNPNVVDKVNCVRCLTEIESMEHVWECPCNDMEEIKTELKIQLKKSFRTWANGDELAESVWKLLGWDKMKKIDTNLSRGLIPVNWYKDLEELFGEKNGRLVVQTIVPFAFERVLFEKIWRPRCEKLRLWIQENYDEKDAGKLISILFK